MTRSVGGILALLAAAALALGCTPAATESEAATPGAELRLADGVRRLDVRYPCGGSSCAAWLYLPPGDVRPPVVVMGHGFAGTRGVALPAFAERFARAGMAAFVFDYRGFGASGGGPRQLVDPWREEEDWKAAVAAARSLPEVDGARVALWGTSMGAGLALRTAASDGALRAVVAQAPLVDSGADGEESFPGVGWLVRLLATAWADIAIETAGGEPLRIPVLAPEGSFGMLVDDDAFAAFERLVAPGASYENAVVAHSVFRFDDWNPAPSAEAIAAPILLLAARGDRFVPYAAVEAFAARAPDARLEMLAGDHFDVYSPPVSDEAAARAIAFLSERFAADATPRGVPVP